MQTITKYLAEDGMEFKDADKCLEHEANCKAAAAIMEILPERPDSCDFSNGSGFILHEPKHLLFIRNQFLEFVKRYTDMKWIQETIDGGFEIDASWAGRAISEACPNTIYKHWYRFQCIDKDHREWGQPYYASHPNEATQLQLN